MQIITLFFLLYASSSTLYAEDLFEDAQIEFDADFEDDFETIEKGSSLNSGAPHLSSQSPSSYFLERDVQRHEQSISLFSGSESLRRVFHLTLFPQGHFNVWKTDGHLGVPLRFPVYDNISKSSKSVGRSRGFVNGGTFVTPRREDFRNFFDAQKVLRHFQIGSDNDPFSLTLSRTQSLSLGQGDLMKNLMPDGLYDQDYLFLQAHADLERVQFNAISGPMIKAHVIGLNAQFQPLSALPAHSFVKDMNVNLSYLGDYFAPLEPVAKVDGSFVLDNEQRLLKREEGNVQAFSMGVASTYAATPWLSLKPYLSYSHLFLNQLEGSAPDRDEHTYGAAFTMGHQFDIYFNTNKSAFLYFLSELRFFSTHYQPNYFGDYYLLDRQTYNENSETPFSKAYYVSREKEGMKYGYLFELGYAFNKIINTRLGFEDGRLLQTNESLQPLRKFHWLSALTINDLMSVYLAYQAFSIDRMRELFDFDKSRGLLSLRGQFKLMHYLYFDAWLKHSFGINDMYEKRGNNNVETAQWLSQTGETRSVNFGLGVEVAMTF